MSARRGLIGLGVGIAAAGAATAAGLATDRVLRSRRAETEPPPAAGVVGVVDDGTDHGIAVIAEDGVPLHVEIEEPAHPETPLLTVIFTHGYAHNLDVWSRQRQTVLDAGCRVVLWDLRGHGRSEEGTDSSYSIEQLGRDLATVIEGAVPEGPIVLVGHSMGGMAMMAFAEQHPDLLRDRVVGVAFISTSAGGLSEVNYGLGKQLGAIVHRLGPSAVTRVGSRQDVFDNVRGLGKPVESVLVHRYSFGKRVPSELVRQVAEMIFATRLHVIGTFLPTLMAHDRHDALAAFTGIETLVMHGTRDRMTPIAHAEQLAHAIPGAELVVVKHAGHVLPLEEADLVDDELLGLIARARRSLEQQPTEPR
ncbi:alpha/beta hydrolase [Flexivirga sp. ID2601S]|uniref:Alpha/beta hydrolase n=1 Tax=Flexivirga aerilata TaxID=1656889 RepID=A0A849ATF1_9MICO|nr:alpha/beta hydrolase [Flexivirga aerilata]NNG40012.1 alpha/beta hydrolase [Flexivirga aerilata]